MLKLSLNDKNLAFDCLIERATITAIEFFLHYRHVNLAGIKEKYDFSQKLQNTLFKARFRNGRHAFIISHIRTRIKKFLFFSFCKRNAIAIDKYWTIAKQKNKIEMFLHRLLNNHVPAELL